MTTANNLRFYSSDFGLTFIKYLLFFSIKREYYFFLSPRSRLIKNIYENGFLQIPNFLSLQTCNELIGDIDNLIKLKKISNYDDLHSDIRIYGFENLSTEGNKFSKNEFFYSLINNFSNKKLAFFSTLANRVEYKKNNIGSGMGWHRDGFYKSFKCMLYLSNVDIGSGQFQLIKNSNSFKQIVKDSNKYKIDFRKDRLDDAVKKILNSEPSRLISLTGSPGTLIIFDTSLIHRGSPIEEGKKRYALTNYYYIKEEITEQVYERFKVLRS